MVYIRIVRQFHQGTKFREGKGDTFRLNTQVLQQHGAQLTAPGLIMTSEFKSSKNPGRITHHVYPIRYKSQKVQTQICASFGVLAKVEPAEKGNVSLQRDGTDTNISNSLSSQSIQYPLYWRPRTEGVSIIYLSAWIPCNSTPLQCYTCWHNSNSIGEYYI